MPILAKKKSSFFRWSSFWSWRVCKQAKLSHLGHARIHWKADASKTSYCLVRILVERHNWAIFLRKWARRGRYSQWRSLSGHVVRIFVHTIWRGGYWQHLISTGRRYLPYSRSYTRYFAPYWRAVKDKCYADKPRGNWSFKGQYSWSHWGNTAAHNR